MPLPSWRDMVSRLIDVFQRFRTSGWRPAGDPHDYPCWIARRVQARTALYRLPAGVSSPSIDLLTLVHNTEPGILCKTAASVLSQDYGSYRWLVWDNGSTRSDTRAVLEELARRPRVILNRSDHNLGITRGHAVALAQAQGDYIALLDHDDCLYADALRILAWHLWQHQLPAFAYSDEDKIDIEDRPFCPFFKPDWSPAFLQATGYTCHLSAFRRQRALELELFSDPEVEGSQDWDAAMRMHDAGERGLHVPEVLYSWRVLPQSTSGAGAAAKPYVLQGQRAVLEASLRRRRLEASHTVEPNELFGNRWEGHWQITRKRGPLPGVAVVFVFDETGPPCNEVERQFGEAMPIDPACVALVRPAGRDGAAGGGASYVWSWLASWDEAEPRRRFCPSLADALNGAVRECAEAYVACVPAGITRLASDWLSEGIGQLERNPRAAIVGGRVLDPSDRVLRGETVLGLGEAVGTPYRGSPATELGYFGLSLDPHDVSALWDVPWIARRHVLMQHPFDDLNFPDAYYLPDLCIRLATEGWTSLFAPRLMAWAANSRPMLLRPVEACRFWQRHRDAIINDPYYSAALSLDPRRVYQLETAEQRQQQLDALGSELMEEARIAEELAGSAVAADGTPPQSTVQGQRL